MYDMEDAIEKYEKIADQYFVHSSCKKLPYKYQYNYVESCSAVGVKQFARCCDTVIPCLNTPGHVWNDKTKTCDVEKMSVGQCYRILSAQSETAELSYGKAMSSEDLEKNNGGRENLYIRN